MAKINLNQNVLPALMVKLLTDKFPALDKFYNDAVKASEFNDKAAGAAAKAKEGKEAAGVEDAALFQTVKDTAIALYDTDNGNGQPRGMSGVTVMQYFAGRADSEGRPDNTGKSYARLCGMTVEALRQKAVNEETVMGWTRPDAQLFFASEDAAARSRVKAKVSADLKGCTVEYANQYEAHLATFRYNAPAGAAPGSDEFTGHRLSKEQRLAAKAAKDGEAGTTDEEAAA